MKNKLNRAIIRLTRLARGSTRWQKATLPQSQNQSHILLNPENLNKI